MVPYRMRLKGRPSMLVLLVVAFTNLNILGTGPTAGVSGGAVIDHDLTRTHILAVKSAHLHSDHQDATVSAGGMATSDQGSQLNTEEHQSDAHSSTPKAETIPVAEEEPNPDLTSSNEWEDFPYIICYGPNVAQQTIGNLGFIFLMAILVVSN
ncbi:uncharacterized protein LOC6527276 [Drosophila yakuba]|uniref:Uncharacterized protein n=1 Tax=Drosophila yakuba TaxID=7245 RepID=B4P1H5_DROYA|nr:uncharacterized protein LOC6527276 [Drosophila yakuba]EDW88082.1 uncharacterized protein Dyak_GE12829 [Drosophila yakuba]